MKPRFVWIVQADHPRSWQVATGNDATLDSTLLLATNTSRREKIAPADIRPRTHPPRSLQSRADDFQPASLL